ncbi:MAG: PhoX family phosphatase, partial [bacterium]|nr:PhoX family phosphatase [bacterium]
MKKITKALQPHQNSPRKKQHRASSGKPDVEINQIIERVLSRRSFVRGGAALGMAAIVSGGLPVPQARSLARKFLSFQAVAANSRDSVTVPPGYSWDVVMSWGDELWSNASPFDEHTGGTGDSQEMAVGDNNDGMYLFTYEGRSILASNNEYANRPTLFGNRDDDRPKTPDDVRKGIAAHGVTICEISQKHGKWRIVKDSPFNRRITPTTPMQITGPAAGSDLMKTSADPTGTQTLGTWANCANGHTPWSTYLTCEENFDGYFTQSDDDEDISDELKRYGIGNKDWGYNWASIDERFDLTENPHEPNRVGYVVEIDPFDPKSTPKKHTALGRFKHENAELVINKDGRVVVYMGDDERGEFLYRFISERKYVEGADNRDLLESGQLYAAKFHDDLRGEWLILTPETTGMATQAEICIHTRQAASQVEATTMDRPESIAVNQATSEVYCTLTNNKHRGKKTNRGGDDMPVGGPNPRRKNKYGQIVRWRSDGGDHTKNGFDWELFVLAGNPTVHTDARKGSANINPGNMFNSPDGLKFDQTGTLWIQTDGKTSNKGHYVGMGNNQMLAADPVSGEIRRFLVGPK